MMHGTSGLGKTTSCIGVCSSNFQRPSERGCVCKWMRQEIDRTTRSIESNVTFRSGKTEAVSLRKMCPYCKLGRRVTPWSSQSQSSLKPTRFSRLNPQWVRDKRGRMIPIPKLMPICIYRLVFYMCSVSSQFNDNNNVSDINTKAYNQQQHLQSAVDSWVSPIKLTRILRWIQFFFQVGSFHLKITRHRHRSGVHLDLRIHYLLDEIQKQAPEI